MRKSRCGFMQAQQLRLHHGPCFWHSVVHLYRAAPGPAKVNFLPLTVPAASLRDTAFSARSAFIMGKSGPMLLGGHRGMGENLATKSPDGKTGVYPAFRENTIESFQQAAKCGVGFVEFDVQVTRDNVPVIWHDDDVVIGPADHPSRPQVKDLTLAELKALCGRGDRGAPVTVAAAGTADTARAGSSPSPSSDGVEALGGLETAQAQQQEQQPCGLLRLFRDRFTRQWATSYEQWKCDQDDAIPTLEAVFAALPPEVGFDIEIKMTTGDDVVHTPSEEVERMLSAILPVVNRCSIAATTSSSGPSSSSSSLSTVSALPSALPTTAHLADGAAAAAAPARRRRIIFSSFDPDVCVELRRRQMDHPVYYLSGCGLYTHADARRTSIPAALSFAAETGMQGIVLPASVLLKNMEMVESASRSHLELMTYGPENNDLDCLKAQADAGVVAAIVDEVAGVTAALNSVKEDDTTNTTSTHAAVADSGADGEGNDSGSGNQNATIGAEDK